MERLAVRQLPITDISNTRVRETKKAQEQLRPSSVQVMLVGMQGEGGFSIHDPIGIGVIARRIKVDHPDVKVEQIDTQPQLAKTGKIDTDALAKRIYEFAKKPNKEDGRTIIGFGTPIYSPHYTKSVIEKYEQLCEEDPPKGKVDIVLGGSIPTHTEEKKVREMFPNVKLVKGEGEERLSMMVRQALNGEEITEKYKPKIHTILKQEEPEMELQTELADLSQYAGADRELTIDIMHHGGMPKIETSRGCGFGACSFCSRDALIGRGGKDYRTVPSEKVVEEMYAVQEILETFNTTRFEITDEDAFNKIEQTTALISALKSAQIDEERPLRRMSFGVSMRVETLNELATRMDAAGEVSLLQQLREVGLDKVFLGVEGGTDAFLKQIAKGQSMQEVAEAVKHVQDSTFTPENSTEAFPLEMEMGYIAFSYRMNMNMLRKNVEFLSQKAGDPTGEQSNDVTKTNAQYVSSLFNLLEVRAGTNDAKHIKHFTDIVNNPEHPKHDQYKKKYPMLEGYNPEEHFNINTSTYEDVPFFDPAVGEAYEKVAAFGQADESLYYAVKSVHRAKSLPETQQKSAQDYFLRMKKLHLQYLRDTVGLESFPNVVKDRRTLVEEMKQTFGVKPQEDALDSVRREVIAFLQEEKERDEVTKVQKGALIVATDEKDRILLVRPRNHDKWAFPGGNINNGENPQIAAIREGHEELGVPEQAIIIQNTLPTTEKKWHHDQTTGPREKLELYHYKAKVTEQIDILQADHEIADTLWLSPQDIANGKVQVNSNVHQIVDHLLTENGKQKARNDRPDTSGEITIINNL